MVNKVKQKRRLRKSFIKRSKEIAQLQRTLEIMRTDKALRNILEERGFFK